MNTGAISNHFKMLPLSPGGEFKTGKQGGGHNDCTTIGQSHFKDAPAKRHLRNSGVRLTVSL